jgi:tripartite-type tricarboxylate transporter receptor subunit TctC
MKKILFVLMALVMQISEGVAQTPYFQGKTIRFIVGYPAGSTHDLWARLVGPYMTKYIPGCL